jgi:hypothetical protein
MYALGGLPIVHRTVAALILAALVAAGCDSAVPPAAVEAPPPEVETLRVRTEPARRVTAAPRAGGAGLVAARRARRHRVAVPGDGFAPARWWSARRPPGPRRAEQAEASVEGCSLASADPGAEGVMAEQDVTRREP